LRGIASFWPNGNGEEASWESIGGETPDRHRSATAGARGDLRAEHLGAAQGPWRARDPRGARPHAGRPLRILSPRMALLIGQSDMPKSRLDRAPKLRAIINVETNFLQNVDYDACFERGIHVLAPGSAFARPVAEMALGMAIDLCRGVTTAAKAYCRPPERVYGVKDSDRGIEHIAQSRFRGVIVPLRAA
jgi:hypothetical protein